LIFYGSDLERSLYDLITVFIYRRLPSSSSPFKNKKASDFHLTSFLVNPKVFKLNIRKWTDVVLTTQFCSVLPYILTQDISLATVFAANFLNFLQKPISDY